MRKRTMTVVLVLVMVVALFAGCSNKEASVESADATTETNEAATDVAKEDDKEAGMQEDITIKLFVDTVASEQESYLNYIEGIEAATGYKIELNVIPGAGDNYDSKQDIALMSGDTTDIISMSNAFREYRLNQANVLLDLTDYAAADGFDLESTFGSYLRKQDDASITGLPTTAPTHAVIYNKKIFDDAGVEYPSGAWSWDDFVETAKQLTDDEKGIYGAFFEPYDYFFYVQARQQDISGYKEDGTSNYDDPAFAKSLEWFGSLGNDLKIAPSWLEIKVKQIPWDAYMQGTYGMMFIGDWHLGLFTDTVTYPRDWQWGITQSPTVEGGNNNLVAGAYVGVNKNSEHPEAAYQVAKYISLNSYKLNRATPANIIISEEELMANYQGLVDADSTNSVTADEIYNALSSSSNGLGVVNEKIVGDATAQYQAIIMEQGELYLVGEQSLEETIANIKEQADKAIEDEK